MSNFLYNEVIRIWFLKNNLYPPSLLQLRIIKKEILLSFDDSSSLFKIKKYKIQKYKNNLYLTHITNINDFNQKNIIKKKIFQKLKIPRWERI